MPSGKSKTQTTTSTTEPPAYVAEQLRYGMQEARDLYNKGLPEFFPNQTYADFTPQQIEAMSRAESRARQGSPLTKEAQANLQATLRGDYINNNPYLNDMINAANRGTIEQFTKGVMPTVQAGLGRSGRYGSNAATQERYNQAQKTLAQQLADTEANIRGQSYEQERARQFQALGLAPTLAAQDYTDIAQLAAVGEQQQAMAQNAINEEMQRYQYNNTIDQQALDQFLGRVSGIGGIAGNVTTQVTPVQGSSPFSQALGVGASLAGAAFGSPWLGAMIAPTTAAMSRSIPMPTYAGGAYGGGYSPYSGGIINWYK